MLQKKMSIIAIGLIVTVMLLFGTVILAQEQAAPVGNSGTLEIAFVITDKALTELRKQELPEDLLTQLETLKDTLFNTKGLFVNALEQAIGQEALAQYQERLLELAYVYDATGRREPFRPAIETDNSEPEAPTIIVGDECPPPLGKYDLGQFQVIGILLGGTGDRAKIKAPDGETYTVTMDSCLGRYAGKVMTISESCITVRETKRYEKGDDVSVQEEDTDLCLKSEDK